MLKSTIQICALCFLVSCEADKPESVKPAPKPEPAQEKDALQKESFSNSAPVAEPEPEPEPKVLARCATTFHKSKSRSHNIRVAAKALDGATVQPNEEFSFNKTVGPRTLARGYKPAIQFFDGEKVPGVGGGVCQVSSTLYMCLRKGALKVTARQAHSRPVDYTPPGTDATVFWGSLDLKFINVYDTPITINTSVEDQEISMVIMGAESPYEMKHIFRVTKVVDFDVRYIATEGVTESEQKQKGRKGYPGVSQWVYSNDAGERMTVFAQDRYKPVPEIWHVPPESAVLEMENPY